MTQIKEKGHNLFDQSKLAVQRQALDTCYRPLDCFTYCNLVFGTTLPKSNRNFRWFWVSELWLNFLGHFVYFQGFFSVFFGQFPTQFAIYLKLLVWWYSWNFSPKQLRSLLFPFSSPFFYVHTAAYLLVNHVHGSHFVQSRVWIGSIAACNISENFFLITLHCCCTQAQWHFTWGRSHQETWEDNSSSRGGRRNSWRSSCPSQACTTIILKINTSLSCWRWTRTGPTSP